MKKPEKSRKRDRAYQLARLERDFHAYYRDFRAGKYASVRAAAVAAGLIREPSHVNVLKRAWNKAAAAEKREFLAWLRSGAATTKLAKRAIAGADGRLAPEVATFLNDWTARKSLRHGNIMHTLGFKRSDWTLSSAATGGTPLRQEVVKALEPWLYKNGFKW